MPGREPLGRRRGRAGNPGNPAGGEAGAPGTPVGGRKGTPKGNNVRWANRWKKPLIQDLNHNMLVEIAHSASFGTILSGGQISLPQDFYSRRKT